MRATAAASFAAAAGLCCADTQSIPLASGMNLVSFAVMPANDSPPAVFGSLGSGFIEAASYDNSTKQWTVYRHPSITDAALSNSLPGLAMTAVGPGRGYLIRMAAPATLSVTGNAPASPAIVLYPGMNLVGFPVPSTSLTAAVGLSDILSGPDFSFSTALQWEDQKYQPFTNNRLADDPFYLFDRNKAFWVHSDTIQTWTPQVAKPPLVFVERGNAIIVEAPLPEANTPVTVNVPIRLTRTFTGKIGFLATGTAQPNTDFSITQVTTPVSPTNSIGELTVSASGNSYQIPVSIKEKPRLQTNSSVFVTLRRPMEAPVVADSATLPQVAQIRITDGKNGIYEGFFAGTGATTTLNGQNFRIALRANGQAVFDPGEGGMISSRFTLPYTLAGGVPHFTGSAQMILATSASLRRNVTLRITPAATVALDPAGTATPSFELPLNLVFTNLTAAGPFQTTAKISLTQADPAL